MRAIAVDWSGRLSGASEFIWRADVEDGRLLRLENGRSREEVIGDLITAARD